MSRSPKRPGVKQYDRAPTVGIPRSTFDRSHPWKGTFDSGNLIPFLAEEIIPGDSYRVRANLFCRLATPLHPTLDNLTIETFFFFVPNRILWDNFQKFMGEQDNPGDSTDYLTPTLNTATIHPLNGMGDYYGIPISTANMSINALPFRAYNKIYKDWFKDENLQNDPSIPTDDGPDGAVTTYYVIQKRGKRKTYITSCLPWPQKGPAINLPLGQTAPVIPDVSNLPLSNNPTFQSTTGNENASLRLSAGADTLDLTQNMTDAGAASWQNSGLVVDLTGATSSTVTEIRQAFQLQKMAERDARGGTRYTEILMSHFKVKSPDQRLQRSEYLGGGRSPVGMQTVPQTSSTDATTPQGNLSAYGTAMVQGHGFTKSFVEHGWVIGLLSVRADLNFQKNIERKWSRSTKHDYYWPALQALGEQPVYNKEIYADGTAADDEVWGYQERWAEYRTCEGKITSLFRSDAPETLDPWHYALDFGGTRPALDATFIEDNPPVKRTIAVQTEPDFLCDAWIDIKAARPMPVYSVPGYIDHF